MKPFRSVQSLGKRPAFNNKKQDRKEAKKNSFSQAGANSPSHFCDGDTVGLASGLFRQYVRGAIRVDIFEWYIVLSGISAPSSSTRAKSKLLKVSLVSLQLFCRQAIRHHLIGHHCCRKDAFNSVSLVLRVEPLTLHGVDGCG